MEDVNSVFEQNELEAAEQILINYYKSEVSKITYWIANSSEAFTVRYDLIQRFLKTISQDVIMQVFYWG
ncbi:MAG: hypothetical protein NC311_17645 [Muribaculaceae bacterium]|nr:hypothetical protein [Muribaculaceae bacterium]